ncbi:type II toxin-antitoxin system HicA family toxin [Nostoc sp. TCL240-02]|uniref:type II toxin-antitoxin system HicA family toxin n=1 Tax=Nostoc sp. TCL240-02 TaxID=2572090 RepID=UPI00157FA2FF|nr:type II toxin-antitoxin system HicA family toxin [Nostoc sp. TCL240-02]QKQ75326.1 type II toxin-antitoxin system HicA family toxin [Nostoc sp. TCL240-02]
MSKLPIVNYQTMEKLLLNLGFEAVRQKGSHVFYRHPDGRTTTVPHHKGRDIARPLIREILREIELSPEEFVQELESL